MRSEHLLRSLGLNDRFVDIAELARVDMENMPSIDFDGVKVRLSVLRENSFNYLKSL